MTGVLLRRVQATRPGAQGDDDYDVIDADGLVIGRIFKAHVLPPARATVPPLLPEKPTRSPIAPTEPQCVCLSATI